MFSRNESLSQFIRLYPVISFLVAANLLIHIATQIPGEIGFTTFWTLAGVNGLIAQGEYWRLISSVFVHADWWHLIFNMFALIIFSPALERMIGSFQYAIVYTLAGLIASTMTFVFQGPAYTSVGASGAIFGVFGLYAAIYFIYRERAPMEIRQVMLPLIIISVIMTFFGSNINVIAHLGGLAAGFFIGMFIFQSKKRT
ncbi:rhomboid family intramembrane serine protease [Jeotgalibacillus sp. R-1-5s-1]|uniref:rhomboid family intramembrane serine protease n=1 Tax=Jeotgalibacillus sp. R-1-5s-1 TaxID=2555897 RepID=UPI00106DCD32|nr:rhomboid family intramembrane serine protease [Jeotgalibacillus sp. R-1-5s-1]TFD98287.1 rhomboid family intramembrane serine protease [Jeotgalibacillus sp. R-1-5s-1]